jgi:hypothetical protein
MVQHVADSQVGRTDVGARLHRALDELERRAAQTTEGAVELTMSRSASFVGRNVPVRRRQ